MKDNKEKTKEENSSLASRLLKKQEEKFTYSNSKIKTAEARRINKALPELLQENKNG